MQYKYSNTVLCDDSNPALGMVGPLGCQINGVQVNDLARYLRASSVSYIPRGNRNTDISFSVQRDFATTDDCDRFCKDHHASLPLQGALVVTYGDATTRTLRNAVLESCSRVRRGTVAVVTYTFKGGLFDSNVAPGPDPLGTDVRQRGLLSLTNGATVHAVAFGVAFGSVPFVGQPSLYLPNAASDGVELTVDGSSITVNGFNIISNVAIPSSGYSAAWFAEI